MNHPEIPPSIPFVDLKTQAKSIRGEILEGISDVIDRCSFILGPQVAEFENLFAEYCQTSHCVGVASGTEALHMALRALDIGPGDEVITAGNSFAATAFAIAYTGAEPVFVDVCEDDFNLDVSLIESAITEKTKAIIPVHLYGRPANMKPLMELAKKYDLRVIEDAAQGHGGEIDGKRCGSFGDIGCFSFYPGKNLGAYGDGGACVTNDEALAERLRLLRNYGQKVKNRHDQLAYNCRLDSMQAAILAVKMKYIETWTEQRIEVASWYRDALHGLDLILPQQPTDDRHVYHLFVVRHPQRDHIISRLAEQKIFAGIHYPNPLNEAQPFLDSICLPLGLPNVKRLSQEIFSLPMFPEMTRAQVDRVAHVLGEIIPQLQDA